MSQHKLKTETPVQTPAAEASGEPGADTAPGKSEALQTKEATEAAAASIDSTQDAPDELRAIQEKAAKADAHWDLYLRARAELENYRRRATRERQEAVRYAHQSVVEKLLPVLDSLEKAIEASRENSGSTLTSLQEGVTLVQTQLKSILAEVGLQEIDASGQAFDPNLHEAVAHHESAEVADGQVLHQVRKGYKLHDRLVRPATVVVAKAPDA
jgi:molecular chaperone GrpE